MIYKGKKMDGFQLEAMKYIDNYENVIVSAPTGTGKTMVADYCIEKCLSEGYRVIYTAPIKALSNQKYREFSSVFGKDKVGILTGDTVINKSAPLLIMTTEIYRNILYSDMDLAKDIKCVVFDEIHYISDEDRGTVWEEAILLKPKSTFLVGLSATIPNIDDLVNWISKTKEEKVNVVYHNERAVPLEHKFYFNGDLIPFDECENLDMVECNENTENEYLKLLNKLNITDFPILYFTFNKRGCYDKAIEYSKYKKIREANVINEIKEVVNKILIQYNRNSEEINNLEVYMSLFYKGIGVHHSGILPIIKLMVEELFEHKLLNIVFCTETFAIGINYPVKTVCIDGYRKFDGHDFRNLLNKEYFQIGGRAGRRGIDEYGKVITLLKYSDIKFSDYPRWNESEMDLLESNFKVSYNGIVNIFSDENNNLERILKDNFAIYLMNKKKLLFDESKERFKTLTAVLKVDCCEDLGKNICPVKYEEDLNLSNVNNEDFTYKRKNKKKKELKVFRNNKIKNCTREKKKYCREKYSQYQEHANEYLNQKITYEECCSKYPEDYFINDYKNKKNLLDKLGYICLKTNEMLVRGKTIQGLYIQELLLCELIYSDFFDKYNEEVICGIISGVDFDGAKIPEDNIVDNNMVPAYLDVIELVDNLSKIEMKFLGSINVRFDSAPCNIVYKIASGFTIAQITKEIKVSDGEVVSIARRTLAILTEIKEAVADRPYLVAKIKSCISKIDRDEYMALF